VAGAGLSRRQKKSGNSNVDTRVAETVADDFLHLLGERGIDYLFANAGTDFSPVIEAFAKAEALGVKVPKPVTVPHEAVAVAMAQGYYFATGRPQAVMVHVTVGTANALGNLINLARANVPLLMLAGRTPLVEGGLAGARDRSIQWAQEAFDQAGMLREYVKWDYELRNANQVEEVVNRAIGIARSEPQGPVYLALPREVLAAPATPGKGRQPLVPSAAAPSADCVAEIARLIRDATSPLILTGGMDRRDTGLAGFAERFAIPVVHHMPQYAALPTAHPMNLGLGPIDITLDADLIIVLECDVPWIPLREKLRADCKVVHVGPDPLFERYPMRSFQADLALRSSGAAAIAALAAELGEPDAPFARAIEERRRRVAGRRARHEADIEAGLQQGMSAGLVTRTLSDICGDDTVYVSDYTIHQPFIRNLRPGQYLGMPPAGCLGWGMGAAMGIKLATPEKLVVAGVGDGTYFLSSPLASHHVSRAENLPFLTVIYNNRRWGAVRNAVNALHPKGYAMSSNRPPLMSLEPSPDFEKIVEACGGAGYRVETRAELRGALEAAVATVRGGRQAVVNVTIP
jgi:acetolactate synthase-1/2/3 large subunit